MADAEAIVVGGGITGLAVAASLAERGRSVLLLEGSPRVGGTIVSERSDGYLIEWGPHSVLASAGPVFRLARAVGLADDWERAAKTARKRWVMRGGRLRALPTGPLGILTSTALPLSGRLRLLAEPFVRSRSPDEETVAEFFRRRFGASVVEHLADPFVGGVYGGLPEELELATAFPRLARLEDESRSVLIGALRDARTSAPEDAPTRRGTFTLREGMEQLPRAIAAHLDRLGVEMRLGSPVTELGQRGGRWQVGNAESEEGERCSAKSLVIATPAAVAGSLLSSTDPELATLVGEIPTASLALVSLGIDCHRIPGPLDGFGFLAPRGGPLRILGAIYDSSVFPSHAPEGKALITVFIGGRRRPGDLELGDAALAELAVVDLGRALGGSIEPARVAVRRWRGAIPQLVRGHRRRVDRIRARLTGLPGLALAGGWLGGVSMSGCIESAERAVSDLEERRNDR